MLLFCLLSRFWEHQGHPRWWCQGLAARPQPTHQPGGHQSSLRPGHWAHSWGCGPMGRPGWAGQGCRQLETGLAAASLGQRLTALGGCDGVLGHGQMWGGPGVCNGVLGCGQDGGNPMGWWGTVRAGSALMSHVAHQSSNFNICTQPACTQSHAQKFNGPTGTVLIYIQECVF